MPDELDDDALDFGKQTSDKMSEELPEDTITPEGESLTLLEDVIHAADEDFLPLFKKLKPLLEKHRVKIVLLKSSVFGVRQGSQGHRVLVHGVPLFWEDFSIHYFGGITNRHLNRLLDTKDEKSSHTIVRTPVEEKPLFKKGLRAGKADHDNTIISLQEKLAALSATPDAQKLAEKVVVLEAQLAEQIGGPVEYVDAAPKPKPTLEDWKKHKLDLGKYHLKYFEQSASRFLDGYNGTVSSVTFRKAFEKVGNPKHTDDLKTLAQLLTDAADDLRTLAQAVTPMSLPEKLAALSAMDTTAVEQEQAAPEPPPHTVLSTGNNLYMDEVKKMQAQAERRQAGEDIRLRKLREQQERRDARPKVGDWIVTSRPANDGTPLIKLWHVTSVGKRGGITGWKQSSSGMYGKGSPEWLPDQTTPFNPQTDRIVSRQEAEALNPELVRIWDSEQKPKKRP
jgi:hypothetical protein